MLNQDYTAKVLNLEDVIITNVENISDVLHICLELPRQKHRCPACGALTDCKDWPETPSRPLEVPVPANRPWKSKSSGLAALLRWFRCLFPP